MTDIRHDEHLLEHDYDGIREYDNPLPGWWRMLFLGTIVFAGFYGLYFHVVGWGHTPDESYRATLVTYESKKALRDQADAANVSEDLLARDAGDPRLLQHGADVFVTRCASCHTVDGRGLIGPNLTDNFQIHGSSRMDIFKTVRGGVSGTAMPAWGEQLPMTDVVAVAAYATTLRGKNLPGKPPQGDPVGAFK
jgi:cytochrome c oxidase cbb3-type subunit 3